MMSKTLTESMSKFVIYNLHNEPIVTIRVWKEDPDYLRKNLDLLKVFERVEDEFYVSDDIKGMAKQFLDVDKVNAVEILDEHGNGIVVYKDWP